MNEYMNEKKMFLALSQYNVMERKITLVQYSQKFFAAELFCLWK
jgi:hypothetical protein